MHCLLSINSYIFFLFHIGDGINTVNIAGIIVISAGFALVSSAVILLLVMTVYVCQKKKKRKDYNIGKYLSIYYVFLSEIASSSRCSVVHSKCMY